MKTGDERKLLSTQTNYKKHFRVYTFSSRHEIVSPKHI